MALTAKQYAKAIVTEEVDARNEEDYFFRLHTTDVGGGCESFSWRAHVDFDSFAKAYEAAAGFVNQGDWIESIRRDAKDKS